MILKNTKKRIILNAGHWDDPETPGIEDPGAIANGKQEAVITILLRDIVADFLLQAGFDVAKVPDNLDLRKSIAWANKKAPRLNDALAVGIHLNYLSNPQARGSEAFYGATVTSRALAEALSRNVSNTLGIPDRGAKPDNQTAVGSLGWIRKTTMWASLIEVCFLTNVEDLKAIQGKEGATKAALGIANGICEIFGVKKLSMPKEPVDQEIIISITEGGKIRKFRAQPIT